MRSEAKSVKRMIAVIVSGECGAFVKGTDVIGYLYECINTTLKRREGSVGV